MNHWRNIKEKQIKEIIEACAGLYLRSFSCYFFFNPKNEKVDVNFEALNRSDVNIELTSITSKIDKRTIVKELELATNKKINFKESITFKYL